jgi:gliding motility-associated-like protein
VVSGVVGTDVINYTLATTATTTSGVGTYPIEVTLGANPNYSVTKTDAVLNITPKAITVVAADKSKVYGDANPTLTAVVSGVVGTDVINYTLATTATPTSGIGNYPIEVTLGANPNYSVTKTDAVLNITPKTITVVAADKSKVYGEANPTLTAVVSGAVGTDVINYTLATTATTTSAVGNYPIAVTLGSNPNYSVTKTDAVLNITPKAITVVAADKSKVYGDANPTLTAVVTGVVGTDVINYTLATTATPTSGIGNYPIEVTLGSNPNYSVTKTDAVLNITPKAITVVAADKSKVYGEANPTLSAVVNGVVGSDVINYTLATTATTTSGVGTYPIEVTLGANPNYSVTKTDAVLNITPKAITVVAADKSKVYGEANPTLTAVVSGIVGTDVINYTLATTATTTSGIGNYPIEVTLGANPNYSVTKTDGNLAVNKKSASVTPDNKSKECSQSNPIFTGTLTGFEPQDGITATYTTTLVGNQYVINATLAPSNTLNNYNISYNTALLTITDNTAPIPTTQYQAVLNVNCDAVPSVPNLVFIDQCSNIAPTVVYSENIINNSTNSYSIIRKWNVKDASNNTAEYTQTVNVTKTTNVITITVPDFINSVNGTPVDLKSYLPQDAPENGTWVDLNNSGALNGRILDPNNKAAGDYSFQYNIETGTCPISYVVNLKIDNSFVLGCGTIFVHNAFTPNDDGTNDNFVIDNINDTLCYPENTVEIYNRWGVLVYETKGYDNMNKVFKGFSEGRVTVNKSVGLPSGTYFYILSYTSVGLQNEIIPNKKQGYLYLTR